MGSPAVLVWIGVAEERCGKISDGGGRERGKNGEETRGEDTCVGFPMHVLDPSLPHSLPPFGRRMPCFHAYISSIFLCSGNR